MRRTFAFYNTVAAGSRITLVSGRIAQPFTFKGGSIYFAPGANLLLRVSVFVSDDPSAPATGEPEGHNILLPHSAVAYFVGNDGRVPIETEVVVKNVGAYLKVHAYNTDAVQHSVVVNLEIETHDDASADSHAANPPDEPGGEELV